MSSSRELPTDTYKMTPRYEQIDRYIPIVPLERRSGITEVEPALSSEEAREQASRCLYCHIHPIFNGDQCVLCGRCADICPEHCIRFAPAEALDVAPATRDALDAQAGEGPLTVYLYDDAKCIRDGL